MADGLRRAAVLGRPIAHSLSPALHRAAYAALGLPWSYDAVDVGQDDLAGVLDGLDAGWAGLSLTMPLKAAVLPLLDEVEPLAAEVGAVNTVVLVEGRRWGFNTDVPGLPRCGLPAPQRRCWAGSGMLAVAAVGASAWPPPPADAGPSRARSFVAPGARARVQVAAEPWERAEEALLADVVVATVPAGGADELAGAVPAGAGALLDVVYAPWPTALAQAWAEHDGVVVGGLELLVQQAVRQVRLMTGREVPVDVVRSAGLSALRDR
jgi:shikimate dehydrogenase